MNKLHIWLFMNELKLISKRTRTICSSSATNEPCWSDGGFFGSIPYIKQTTSAPSQRDSLYAFPNLDFRKIRLSHGNGISSYDIENFTPFNTQQLPHYCDSGDKPNRQNSYHCSKCVCVFIIAFIHTVSFSID